MKHLPLIGLTLLLTACGGDDASTSDGSSVPQSQPQSDSKMSLAFSDAPVDNISKVCIAVASIGLHPAEVTEQDTEEDTEPAISQGVEQSLTTASFLSSTQDDGCTPAGESIPQDDAGRPLFTYIDLLAYQGSSSRPLLTNQRVAPGNYSQMRLRILDGREPANQFSDGTPYSYVKQDDGVIKPLEVPSSELKLDAFTIAANGLSDFTTEFDLRHAMVLPGSGDYYKLKPRGVRLVDNSMVVTFQGRVDPALCGGDLSNAFIYFYQPRSDDNYPDMIDGDNGFYASAPVRPQSGGGFGYELGFVNLGTYDMALVCNGNVDDPEVADDVLTFGLVEKNLTSEESNNIVDFLMEVPVPVDPDA